MLPHLVAATSDKIRVKEIIDGLILILMVVVRIAASLPQLLTKSSLTDSAAALRVDQGKGWVEEGVH